MIRVVDFETDGTAPPSKVIEVGWCDLRDDVVGEPRSRLCGGGNITAETRAVHHITPAEIAGASPFDPFDFVNGSLRSGALAFAAHHADFEAQWLTQALNGTPILCTYKAALRVWPDAPSHKNQVLRYWLEERGLASPDPALCQPAHRAGPDAYATAHLLAALLAAGTSVEDMIAWTAEPAALPRCPIGEKWRGKKWAEVDPGFLGWMLRQPTMDPDLKWNAQRELARRGSDGPIT